MRRSLRVAGVVVALGLAAVAATALLGAQDDDALQVSLLSNGSAPGRPLFNDREGKPVLDVRDLQPGERRSAEVRIANPAAAPQVVALRAEDLRVDKGGDAFDLEVLDLTTGRALYSGPLVQLREVEVCGAPAPGRSTCPAWTRDQAHIVRFTVEMRDVGNEYAGSGASLDFVWTARPARSGA